MKKNILATAMLFSALTYTVNANAQAIDTAPDGYTLRWSDEFNEAQLNEKIWNIEVNGNGGGNQELQYYRRENVSMGTDPKSGEQCLVLTAKRESYQGKQFTSGRVTSQNKAAFKHGFLQARIKFPKTANGLWPAYWMMGNDMSRYGWPRCGEMDIIELGHFNGINAGTQDRYFGGTLHYGPSASNTDHRFISSDVDVNAIKDNPVTNDEYHIFTVEWDDNYINMYYDLTGFTRNNKNKARYASFEINSSDDAYSLEHYFQKPFFFLFNLAVGGTYTNIYNADGITALKAGEEAKMYIDWVRVYQKDDDTEAQYTYIDENGKEVTNIDPEPEPEPQPDDKTPLSGFATKALDATGNPTFNFADGYDYVLISTSDGVTGHCLSESNVLKDYNVNNDNRNLYIWSDTYVPNNRTGKANSFGWEEGYSSYSVASVGWSGLGFNIKNEDFSMIDDTYWLHFAMKGSDIDLHTSHEMQVGKAKFRIGLTDGKLASVGDFPRDGQWYFFDIPVKALRQFDKDIFVNASNIDDNIITFISGGVTDAELTYDNIFFYRSHSKKVPTYTDNSADLGQYGYKSIKADGTSAFDLSDVEEIIPLVLTEDVWDQITAGGSYEEGKSYVKADRDYTMQGGKNNFFIWGDPQTMTTKSVEGVANSFGRIADPFPAYISERADWNGAGWASMDGMGFNPKPKDLSMIDDSYYLHISLRSEEAVSHIPVMIRLGGDNADACIVFGSYSDKAIFADFNRNGEWYSFDIPVSVLKQYGQLWSTAPAHGGLSAFTDYVLCIYTMPTMYTGSSFCMDNVFFFKRGEAPVVSDLGPYGIKSSDQQFNFEEYTDYVPVVVGAEELAKMNGKIASDCTINDQTSHLYPWEGTYVGAEAAAVSSFGTTGGSIDFRINNNGWAGFGLISDEGFDVSMLDETYFLHFAMRGTDDLSHGFSVGQAKFSMGTKPVINDGVARKILGNYKRDGEWYSFDIPFTELKKLTADIFPSAKGGAASYKDNFFWGFCGEGQQGKELHIDNIFFYHPVGTDIKQPITTTTYDAKAEIYDLSGRRVSAGYKGIAIVKTANGYKKIVK